MDCIFCKIIAGDLPAYKLYEDERTLAFLDLFPGCEGHCLVIPKAHAVGFLDLAAEDREAVMATAHRVSEALVEELGSDGFNLHQSNGSAAGQVIFHFHLHILPRMAGDALVSPWRSSEGDSVALEKLAEALSGRIAGQ
jgi:histidine triad (HIT) family protein